MIFFEKLKSKIQNPKKNQIQTIKATPNKSESEKTELKEKENTISLP